MKILHIVSSANPRDGGPIEGIKQRALVLTAMGHQIEIATLDDPSDPWISDISQKTYALGPSNGSYRFCPNLLPWLTENHKNYDACFVHGAWQYHGIGSWKALHNTSTPYFVFTHGMLDPWFQRQYPLKHLKKSIYWLYAEHKVLRDAAAVCFTSEDEKILARRSFRPYRVVEEVVAYGTNAPTGDADAQKEAFRQICPETAGKSIYLFLSRIHEKKGCDLLIQAFAKFASQIPDIHLVMAGPDKTELKPTLQKLANDLGIGDKISWPGMLSGEVKWGAFRSAEVFSLPSHQENFGIAVVEAMACGCPVLISNKVNIWREIEADGAGIVENDDLAGAERMLGRWNALTAPEKAQMREDAVASFKKRYETTDAAKSLIDVIEKYKK
jgi:glycosyltransferase involved in cell wall biosynthesis